LSRSAAVHGDDFRQRAHGFAGPGRTQSRLRPAQRHRQAGGGSDRVTVRQVDLDPLSRSPGSGRGPTRSLNTGSPFVPVKMANLRDPMTPVHRAVSWLGFLSIALPMVCRKLRLYLRDTTCRLESSPASPPAARRIWATMSGRFVPPSRPAAALMSTLSSSWPTITH